MARHTRRFYVYTEDNQGLIEVGMRDVSDYANKERVGEPRKLLGWPTTHMAEFEFDSPHDNIVPRKYNIVILGTNDRGEPVSV